MHLEIEIGKNAYVKCATAIMKVIESQAGQI